MYCSFSSRSWSHEIIQKLHTHERTVWESREVLALELSLCPECALIVW